MRILSKNELQNLSFPDFDVEEIEFFHKDKKLKISIEGAWLNTHGGCQLSKGTLYFSNWENLVVNKFDPDTEKWSTISSPDIDPLRDICEFTFRDKSICLCGFGKISGYWVKWEISNTEISAEFEK